MLVKWNKLNTKNKVGIFLVFAIIIGLYLMTINLNKNAEVKYYSNSISPNTKIDINKRNEYIKKHNYMIGENIDYYYAPDNFGSGFYWDMMTPKKTLKHITNHSVAIEIYTDLSNHGMIVKHVYPASNIPFSLDHLGSKDIVRSTDLD